MIGDFARLPVVRGQSIWKDLLFKKFEVYNLTEIQRSRNSHFHGVLNKIRVAHLTDDVCRYFKEKIDHDFFENFASFDMDKEYFITAKRETRDKFNQLALPHLDGVLHKKNHLI